MASYGWCSIVSPTLGYFHLVGGLEHVLFSHILGMSSSQLTFTFFRGVGQPPASHVFSESVSSPRCCQEEELRADELRAAGLLSTGEDVSPEETFLAPPFPLYWVSKHGFPWGFPWLQGCLAMDLHGDFHGDFHGSLENL